MYDKKYTKQFYGASGYATGTHTISGVYTIHIKKIIIPRDLTEIKCFYGSDYYYAR